MVIKGFFFGALGIIVLVVALSLASCNTRHHAKIYKLKNHHIVMRDDRGRWFEYVLKNADIDFDVPVSSSGRIQLPAGGNWRAATQQEEEEVTEANEVTTEEANVSETDAGEVDGDGGGG